MAFPNYIEPQLNIAQILTDTDAALVSRLNGLVIGSQYVLSRYGKEDIALSDFSSTGDSLSYQTINENDTAVDLPIDYAVDVDGVEVYGEDLQAELANFTSNFFIDSLDTPYILRLDSGLVKGAGLNAAFDGRAVQVGDKVVVDDGVSYTGANAIERTVVGLLGSDQASTYGTDAGKSDGLAANSVYNPIEDATADAAVVVASPGGWTVTPDQTNFDANIRGSSRINNKYSEEFIITVRTAGAPGVATVDINSTSGIYSALDVATASDGVTGFDITDAAAGGELAGVNVNLDQGGDDLAVGQVFKFQVFGAYERLDTPGQLDVADYGSGYTGTTDTTYVITVTTGTAKISGSFTGAEVRISDTSGVDEVQTLTVTDATSFAVGSLGLQATFTYGAGVAQGGLRAGDTYYVHAVAPSQSGVSYDKVLLDGPAADTTLFQDAGVALTSVSFRLDYSGVILSTDAPSGTAWVSSANSLDYNAGVSLYVAERTLNKWVPFLDSVGKIGPSFRARVVTIGQASRVYITSSSDIIDNFGKIDVDNDLAFGASQMLSGAQGRGIYALRVNGETVEDYAEALKGVENTDTVYALVPLTDDEAIADLVVQHCEAMSVKTIKNFRRCYIGIDSPGEFALLEKQDNGSFYTAEVSAYAGLNRLVTFSSGQGVDLIGLKVQAGDLLRIDGGEYAVDTVVSATELIIEQGTQNPLSPAVPVEIWKPDTAQSQADYLISRAQAISSRRGVVVWTENGRKWIDGKSVIIPNKYLAAEIAGLRIAVVPQQGLTRTEIRSVTDIPAMYTRYSREILNEIGSNGVFIVTQEVEGGVPYIRHQVTTETNEGILAFEDSPGVNLDDLSLKIKDVFGGYIGRKNVTPETITEIENQITRVLVNAETRRLEDADIGVQILGYRDLTVDVDEVLKDRINASVVVLIPLPLNILEITLVADQDLTL